MAKYSRKFKVFFILERGEWQTDIMSDKTWAQSPEQAGTFMRHRKCLDEYAPYKGWRLIVVKVEDITPPQKPMQLVLPGFGGDQE